MNTLPDELILWIMKMLPPRDVLHASRVSRRWHILANHDPLWMEIYRKQAKSWRVVKGNDGTLPFMPAQRPSQLVSILWSAIASESITDSNHDSSWRSTCIRCILAEEALSEEEGLSPVLRDAHPPLSQQKLGTSNPFMKLLGLNSRPPMILILGQEGVGRSVLVHQLFDTPAESEVKLTGFYQGDLGYPNGGVAMDVAGTSYNVVSLHRVDVLDADHRDTWRTIVSEASAFVYVTESDGDVARLTSDRQILSTILSSEALGAQTKAPLTVLVRCNDKKGRSINDISDFLQLKDLCEDRPWCILPAGIESPAGPRLALRWIDRCL